VACYDLFVERLKKEILKIFYFPLVILTFGFVFVSFFSLKNGLTSEDEVFLTDGSFDVSAQKGYFNNQLVLGPTKPYLFSAEQENLAVLSATSGEKWIDVNLTTQVLTAFEPDGRVFMQVPISSGLWAPTPTGTFRIWIKLRYALMRGGSQALGTYYYLPNVPCTQYFYKGYGLHGAYWHNNFGHPMSHGCVNMAPADACKLFEWTSPPIAANENMVKPTSQNLGTLVVIHY